MTTLDKFQRHTEYGRKPSTWTDDARRHVAVAQILWKARSDPCRTSYETSGCFYSYLFHASVAVETAYKAVLVRRDPALIQDGAITGELKSHKLLDPVQKLLPDLTAREKNLLRKLEKFSEIGRYSVPINAAPFLDAGLMDLLRNSDMDEMADIFSVVDRLCALALEEEHAA